MPGTKDKQPEKEESKETAAAEQTEIDEKNIKEESPKKEVKVEERPKGRRDNRSMGRDNKIDLASWQPKTELGKKVKSGEITQFNEIFENGLMIKEAQIVDTLIPDLQTDLLLIGQSKGKFGGGKRRVFRQTQKKTQEGNKPKFATYAVAGTMDGFVGLGYGKAKETVPAREKALRNAKLNIIKIRRGCGSWTCGCKEAHTIPFAVEGKCGSVILKLMPAPKGTGLRIEKECQKILKLAGIKDIWSKTKGKTTTKINVIKALSAALHKLMQTKIQHGHVEELGIIEGVSNE